jgi:excinuclease ABC subunit A
VLDEPTTGLHFSDIELLMAAMSALRDAGNTVVIIEHNIDVVACCDWVVDLGPGGGEHGGQLVAEGTPEQIAEVDASVTGHFLRERLGSARSTAASSKSAARRSAGSKAAGSKAAASKTAASKRGGGRGGGSKSGNGKSDGARKSSARGKRSSSSGRRGASKASR